MQFDIDRFYNYYTNPSNLQVDKTPPTHQFYDNNGKIHFSPKSGNYITILGKKIYIEVKNSRIKEILFTIHDPTDPHNLDNHFHFGIRDKFNNYNRKIKDADVIYFHKTTQNFNETKKDHKNCYFMLNADISHIEDIDCVETKDKKMKFWFPVGSEDLAIIKRIIQIPFGIPELGGKRRTRKHKKIHRKTIRKFFKPHK